LHVVAVAIDLREQSHLLGNGVAQSPEVDDIPPATESGGPLDEGRLESRCPQPIGKRGPGNSSAGDENPPYVLSSTSYQRSTASPWSFLCSDTARTWGATFYVDRQNK
jgi:hypothetical protein